jgi:hypothetical protein
MLIQIHKSIVKFSVLPRFEAKLEVVLRVETPVGTEETTTIGQGWFIRGLSERSWGGAEWIGLADANDTASQYRAVANAHALGF